MRVRVSDAFALRFILLTRFEGTLLLRPGKYRVKFLVDNEWRLAADWPMEKDAEGNEVCLLTVT